jgi:dehydrogenase/reductase SDR family protein 7B
MNTKVIWITGASSGIGEALAYEYSNLGAKLILSSRNRDELYRVKANCKNQINVHIVSLDLNESESLDEKALAAIRIFGKIDLLINSGGISQRSLALDTQPEVERKVMNVNFWGTVALSKAVLPNMITNGGGHIVCISSLTGKFGTRLRSTYAASKHALHGYFDSLRSEVYDKKVFITLICPGFVKTNVTLNAVTGSGEPLGTMGEAHEHSMSVEECAKEIVKAIKNKKEEVYIGGKEVKGIWFKRFLPLQFSKYMRTAKVT